MQEVLNKTNGHSLPPNQRAPREYTLNEEELKDIIFNATSRDTRALRKLMQEKRDYDNECDYPSDLSVSDHYKFYFDYHAVGTRVCEVLPLETWQVQPSVFEDDDPNVKTEFEKAWDELGSSIRGQSWHKKEEGSPVWEYLKRADILSGIGSFGVILLGFDDGQPLNTPVAMLAEEDDEDEADSWDTSSEGENSEDSSEAVSGEIESRDTDKPTTNAQGSIDSQYDGSVFGTDKVPKLKEGTKRKLIFMRPFDETLVQVTRLETDINSPRHNQPVMYRLTLIDPDFAKEHNIAMNIACPEVHWTRILHIADNLTNSECFGVPRQQPVYRHLRNLYKLYGGAPEMYWRGALNGLSFETHPQLGGDVDIDENAFKNQIEDYRNGLQRDLLTRGMTVKSVAPQVVDPTPNIEVQITAICIKLGCPKRIFMGSERGELASTQDDSAWNDRLKHRQDTYVTPRIIIPFIDRMIATGVLPKPQGKIVEENLTEDDGNDQTSIDQTKEAVANFNPNQPRDAEGQFSSGGSSGAAKNQFTTHATKIALEAEDDLADKIIAGTAKRHHEVRVKELHMEAHRTHLGAAKEAKKSKDKALEIEHKELAQDHLTAAQKFSGLTLSSDSGKHTFVKSTIGKKSPTANAFGKPPSSDSKEGFAPNKGKAPPFGGKPSSGAPSGDNVGTGAPAPAAPKARKLPEKDSEPGYCIVWPDLDSMTDAQKATIALQKTQALMAFIAGNGESAMTLVDFYTKVLYLTDEEAIGIIQAVNEQIEEDERLTPDPEQARIEQMEMEGEKFDKELEAKKELAESGQGFQAAMFDKQTEVEDKRLKNQPKGKPVANLSALDKARLLVNRMEGVNETEDPFVENYNPNQPRDNHGRWGSGGGGKATIGGGQGFPTEVQFLEHVKFLGGSTGATLVKDTEGNLFVRKTGTSPDHLRAEFHAEKAYQAAGVAVPDSKLYETSDGPVKLSKFIEGKTYNQLSKAEQDKVNPQIQKHFAVDAALANWDVVGMSKDNILVDKHGTAHRIDVGGSLDYRAKGAKKGAAWNKEANEFESLRNSATNSNSASIFKPMSNEQLKESANHLHANKAEILKALPDKYHDTVSARIDAVKAKAEALPASPKSTVAASSPAITKAQVIVNPSKTATAKDNVAQAKALQKQGGLVSGGENFKKPASPLNNGDALAAHIKGTSSTKLTPLQAEKIAFLNPNGIENGVIKLPFAVDHVAIAPFLPAGTKIVAQATSKSKMSQGQIDLGKSTSYKTKTTKSTATSLTGMGGVVQVGTVIPASMLKNHDGHPPESKYVNAVDKHKLALPSPQLAAISHWKGSAAAIRKDVAEGTNKTGHGENIIKAIEKAPEFQGVVYRGIHSKYAQDQMLAFEAAGIGGTWSDPAPMGVSRSPKVAVGFSYGDVLLRIQTKKAKGIDGTSASKTSLSGEKEAIMMPGTTYKILEIHKSADVSAAKGDTKKVKMFVHLEEI